MNPCLALAPALLTSVLLTSPATAQQVLLSSPATAQPIPLSSPTTAQQISDPPSFRAQGEIDDALPLPNPAEFAAGPEGDVLVAPASGNPYFLGFVAGRYYPPEVERIDPALVHAQSQLGGDERPSDEVYGFVMLNTRLSPARIAQLQELGLRPLGFHPHYSLRAAIPAGALPLVASHEAVRWVGVAPAWQKIHPDLFGRLALAEGAPVAAYINVFESDLCADSIAVPGTPAWTGGPGEAAFETADPTEPVRWHSRGWMQRALERLGVEVIDFLPSVNAFRAELRPDQLAALAALDFVQFVEAQVPPDAHHEESMPMVLADWGRWQFDGGLNNAVVAGIIDSGVDVSHSALDHIYHVGWNEAGPGSGPAATDGCGHGTHVAGTILAEPAPADAAHRGVAPGLGTWQSGRFRIVKYTASDCTPAPATTSTIVDWTSHMQSSFVDSFGVLSPSPMVVNNSYGSAPVTSSWIGSELDARVIDDQVYDFDQVYVYSAGNAGPGAGTTSIPGVAKNALTVGAVYDYNKSGSEPPGTIKSSSSRGPCGDGRWKPNVVAPGDAIVSVEAGTSGDFTTMSGTSMAAPHVTGIVAQLLDQNASLRYEPARVMSLLQATATTKDGIALTTEIDSHFDNYGCGRVSAGKLLSPSANDWSWLNWDVAPTATYFSSTFEYADFVVPAGTRRLVVCMSYVEQSASSGASLALLNDWDLYIDQPPLSAAGNVGDYTLQQSPVDNTEIRVIDDPISGVWRWKAYPTAIVTGALPYLEEVKMSVTVLAITGDPTPSGSLTVTTDPYVRPGELVDISATVAVNSYVASAVFLDSTVTPVQPMFDAASTTLIDGPVTNLLGNVHAGRDVLLGDILGQSSRSADWTVHWSSEGTMTFRVDALSDNFSTAPDEVVVVVDGTPPGAPATVHSPTHAPGTWSKGTKLDSSWSGASDALSGVQGYSVRVSSGAPAAPDQVLETTGTSYANTVSTSAIGYYLNVRSVDKSDNWSSGYTSNGPYLIDTVLPGPVSNLKSATHVAGQWSKNPNVAYNWQPGLELHSGVAGYSVLTTSGAPGLPDTTPELGAVTSHSTILASFASGYYFNIRSVDAAGNWESSAASAGPFLIDTLAPSAPTGLSSPSHTIGVPSTNPTVVMNWTAALDALSGVAGYDTLFDHAPGTIPSGVIDTSSTTQTTPLEPSTEGWWFHVRAVDQAGNAGATAHLGPFEIDLCSAAATSASYGTGKSGLLGIPQLLALTPPELGTTLTLKVELANPGSTAALLIGTSSASIPYDGGFVLVVPTLVLTLPGTISPTGSLLVPIGLPMDPTLCGAEFFVQAVIPDPSAGTSQLAMSAGQHLTLGS